MYAIMDSSHGVWRIYVFDTELANTVNNVEDLHFSKETSFENRNFNL